MKILQASWTPHKATNPFVYTLMDEIESKHNDVVFGEGIDEFYKDSAFDYDIVHIHWPEALFNGEERRFSLEEAKKRIDELKLRGIKIVCQCHNLEPHYTSDSDKIEIYKHVYSHSDVIVHLGEYSKHLLEEKYPDVKHVVIPHHVYDTVYTKIPTKEEARKRLGLKKNAKYILCFGAFRGHEEQLIVSNLAKRLKSKGIYFLAPGFQYVPEKRKFSHYFKLEYHLKFFLKYFRNIIITGKSFNAVSDEELPYYYAAADACLIHRKKILNSGNLIMALYMGKPVVGPNTGNVGLLLQETGNPNFKKEDDSIFKAVVQVLELIETDKGKKNQIYTKENFSTGRIANSFYFMYKDIDKM